MSIKPILIVFFSASLFAGAAQADLTSWFKEWAQNKTARLPAAALNQNRSSLAPEHRAKSRHSIRSWFRSRFWIRNPVRTTTGQGYGHSSPDDSDDDESDDEHDDQRNHSAVFGRLADLQRQINAIELTPGPRGEPGPAGPAGGNSRLDAVASLLPTGQLLPGFPAQTFNAYQCAQNSGNDMSVTIGSNQYRGIAFAGKDEISQLPVYYAAFETSEVLPANNLVGAAANVALQIGQRSSAFGGLVSAAGVASVDNGQVIMAVKIENTLALQARNQGNHAYQGNTVPSLLEYILQANGIDFSLSLNNTYGEEDFILQYQQTDLQFVSRLLSDNGMLYHFADDGELLITDQISTQGNAIDTLYAGYLQSGLDNALVTLRLAGASGSASFNASGLDYQQAGTLFSASESADGFGTIDVFSQSLDSASDVQSLALLLKNRDLSTRSRALGSGNYPEFRSGKRITISDQSASAASTQWLLTGVRHVALRDADNDCINYANQFTASGKISGYQPIPKQPDQKIAGVITATVTGPAGQRYHTDELGRVQVRFHWGDESAWLRVMMPAGRLGDSNVFIPEIGDEVVISFVEGDPDRPIVIGTVFNSASPPPIPLPDSLD